MAQPPARGRPFRGAKSRNKPGHKPVGAGRVPAMRNAEMVIESLGARGDGVARLGDDLVFVPYTVPGDKVLVRIEGKRGDGLAGAAVEVIEAGPGRIAAPCPHFGTCGGCALQHVSPDLYGEWKRTLLVTALGRAGFRDIPIALTQIDAGNRRRASFAFKRVKGGIKLGFNGRASHDVIDVTECGLLVPELAAFIAPLRRMLAEIVTGGGTGSEDGDVVATLTETGLDVLISAEARLDLFDREKLAAFAETHDLARLSWKRPGFGAGAAAASGIEPVAARRNAMVSFAGLAVEPPPGGFLQPSVAGERVIAAQVQAWIGGAKNVLDLFAGCGSFTFPLAIGGAAVHGVEGDEAATRALQAAVDRSGGALRVTSETRDLARRPLLAAEMKKYDAALFDPPRLGAAEQAEQLAKSAIKAIVAISCNPATLARDARILAAGGYDLVEARAIDQFPHSHHLEAMALFRRN